VIVVNITARKGAEIVRQVEQDLRAELPKVGRLKLRNVIERIRSKMRGQGKKSSRPVRWDSDKQRMAFFATGGFGRGIPTVRTGTYLRGWEVVEKDSAIGLINKTAGAKYIGGNAYGLGQSRIHKNRWRLLRDVIDQEIDKLPDEMRAALFVVARRVAKEAKA
jgi:hypothetical protein